VRFLDAAHQAERRRLLAQSLPGLLSAVTFVFEEINGSIRNPGHGMQIGRQGPLVGTSVEKLGGWSGGVQRHLLEEEMGLLRVLLLQPFKVWPIRAMGMAPHEVNTIEAVVRERKLDCST
jgi:hypothetical protein